jgi:TRAP-type mannitol/chloroaromatic compound transport system substrate-binding protein
VIFGASEILANRLRALTDGKFDIRVFAAGELVPGLQVLDAVQNGTVEVGHTASYYYVGKDRCFAFDTAIPFGMSARQLTAWQFQGGGLELMREFYKDYNVISFPGGNTGTQMGGWFRKELKSAADLKGLKMRIPGFGGEIMSRLGVIPQTIAGGDIYPALEKGTIDAAEWVGPYDDEKLGFSKVAKFYYYPGFWEPSAGLTFFVNIKEWDKLPPLYKAAFEMAASEANVQMLAAYDARNPAALVKILKSGAQLRAYPADIMEAGFKETTALLDEESNKNPKFKKIFASWNRFRSDQANWFKVAENKMSNFQASKP